MHICQASDSVDVESLVVAGDLILDQYISGTVRRNAPEADVPVVEQEETEYFPGGAANVAMNLAALGTAVVLVGAVGDDEEGKRLLSLLTSANVDVSGVQVIADRPTCRKTRIIGNGRHLVRLDREVVIPIGEEQQRAALDSVRRYLPRARGMVCSDYNKGFLCESVLRSLLHEAVSLDRKVIVDPKIGDCSRYAGATVLMPNLNELRLLSGLPVVSPTDIDAAARAVLTKAHPEALLVTRGADGIVLYESNGKSSAIPGKASTARDVSGAGDSCAAAFAWAYLVCGQSLEAAAELANNAGSIAVTRLGTTIVAKSELLEAPCSGGSWKPEEALQNGRKIVSLDECLTSLNTTRGDGQIVFTNGCFDLLHAGHIEYLQKAKALGKLLVVGLNSDASVRRSKGHKRPIAPLSQRAAMLAALSCVDYVVQFEDDTPLSLIETIRPDILVKGNDYLPHQVVGRDAVLETGGRLELVPFSTQVSTSAVIQKIVDRYRED
ncbi:uncharacterized protein CDV56_103185 [Aspergillus thermomutatus]|uniref:D-glycero-beta-D-manno-heptose 1-phosphate adenylyltransferase n=1 Tax=Aspergillus thermomutatus TaxID=41047 RepID=A0A397GG38_ASPTH|nr:uncharacterized protein CDV56_103185 [Aspergillus thermomutatus]RHZ48608.1 hypothetical protein CDV56_103185 [Aspergillus thermomutatus]